MKEKKIAITKERYRPTVRLNLLIVGFDIQRNIKLFPLLQKKATRNEH